MNKVANDKAIKNLGLFSFALTFLILTILFSHIDTIGKRAFMGLIISYMFLPIITTLFALNAIKLRNLIGITIISLIIASGIRIGFLNQGFYPITPFLIASITVGFILLWYTTIIDKQKRLIEGNPIILPFLLLIIGAILSIPFVRDPRNFIVWNLYALTTVCTSLVINYSFQKYDEVMNFAIPTYIIISTLLISTVFIMPPEYLSAGLIQRYAGIFGTPNRPGIFASFSLFIGISAILYTKNKILKLFFISTVITLFLAILKTASRNAFLSVALGFWIFQALLLYKNKQKRLFFFIAIIISGIITFVIALILMTHSKTLMLRMTTGAKGDLSVLTRIMLWRSTLMYILKNPIHIFIGSGPAQFYYYRFSLGYIFPHNVFINFWFSFGIFGLMALFVLLYYTLKETVFLLKNAESYTFKTYAIKTSFIASLFIFWFTSLFDEVQWGIWGIEVVYFLAPYLVITFKSLRLTEDT